MISLFRPVVPRDGGFFAATSAFGIVGSLTSAVLTIVAFPPYNLGWVAWLALVPLLLSLQGRSLQTGFFLGWLYGLAAMYGLCYWIFQVPGFRWYHGFFLAMYLGMFPAAWAVILCLCWKNNPYLFLLGPTFWVLLDYVKAHAGFLAYPWTTFDLSQHVFLPFLQIASVTGGYGITFLLILFNLALAKAIQIRMVRPVLVPILFVSMVMVWGNRQICQPVDAPSLRVAAIQPAILLRERKSEAGLANSRRRLQELTQKAASRHAELIIWPETALRNLANHPEVQQWVEQLAASTGKHTCKIIYNI